MRACESGLYKQNWSIVAYIKVNQSNKVGCWKLSHFLNKNKVGGEGD